MISSGGPAAPVAGADVMQDVQESCADRGPAFGGLVGLLAQVPGDGPVVAPWHADDIETGTVAYVCGRPASPAVPAVSEPAAAFRAETLRYGRQPFPVPGGPLGVLASVSGRGVDLAKVRVVHGPARMIMRPSLRLGGAWCATTLSRRRACGDGPGAAASRAAPDPSSCGSGASSGVPRSGTHIARTRPWPPSRGPSGCETS